ncbi:hypothetical protein Ddye_021711 [Dipteronia dyeriana]|uniref:Uncharacterized protein n=1 Tax=Dipteronia dyeriana TaxID=168575 RepID=A0AAD9WX49_9ROSI|nr:hypothetical protein Ddye_021711 [Dipteronia dyeriana]
MASCFGHFITMHRRMKFLGGVIHWLLLRELHHKWPLDEMQFMLGNQIVWFSKVEFCLITGLLFGDVLDTSRYAIMDNGIHQWYFAGRDEISFEELRVVLSLDEFQQAYDSVKLCLFYMLNWILMRLDERVKIPVGSFGWWRISMLSTSSHGVATYTVIPYFPSSMSLTATWSGSRDASIQRVLMYTC